MSDIILGRGRRIPRKFRHKMRLGILQDCAHFCWLFGPLYAFVGGMAEPLPRWANVWVALAGMGFFGLGFFFIMLRNEYRGWPKNGSGR